MGMQIGAIASGNSIGKAKVENDPNMNGQQKQAVEKAMDVLASCHGDTSKLGLAGKMTVAAGDQAFNESHPGAHADHLSAQYLDHRKAVNGGGGVSLGSAVTGSAVAGGASAAGLMNSGLATASGVMAGHKAASLMN